MLFFILPLSPVLGNVTDQNQTKQKIQIASQNWNGPPHFKLSISQPTIRQQLKRFIYTRYAKTLWINIKSKVVMQVT